MKEVLERYEYLMVYRLMDGRGLEADDVREMLDGYYKLRKAVEEERIPAKACATVRNDRTEESGRQIAAPKESAFAAQEKPKKTRKREPETAPGGGGVAEGAKPMRGFGAKLKNAALERYAALREKGMTGNEILQTAQGSFSASELYAMLNREKVDFTVWEAFDAVLGEIEKKREAEEPLKSL